jgi:hypothetical protein
MAPISPILLTLLSSPQAVCKQIKERNFLICAGSLCCLVSVTFSQPLRFSDWSCLQLAAS